MSATDPLLKIEANNKLSDLELQADLKAAGEEFGKLNILQAPEIKELTTPEELAALIKAVKAGTASNNQLTRFVNIANKILEKI